MFLKENNTRKTGEKNWPTEHCEKKSINFLGLFKKKKTFQRTEVFCAVTLQHDAQFKLSKSMILKKSRFSKKKHIFHALEKTTSH